MDFVHREELAEVVSVFDLFKIGIGPSSSHCVGPMVAAARFARRLERYGLQERVERVTVTLYGSLALTGPAHGSNTAIMLGLSGERPDEVDPDVIPALAAATRESGRLKLNGEREIAFDERRDLELLGERTLDYHPNALTFCALDGGGAVLETHTYYSVGGGFVVGEHETADDAPRNFTVHDLPYPFTTAAEMLALSEQHGLTIPEMAWRNELALRSGDEVRNGLRRIWNAMQTCIERGCRTGGVLPGGLGVKRRAPELYKALREHPEVTLREPDGVLDWIDLFALAVNEENAAGGRVVTAPTNGAAGIVPAVLSYFHRFQPGATEQGVFDFLLTAAAIGGLYKRNASISGAEVGCQGEVGVACSMAAAGLAAARGGSSGQIENAAEIAMEHNLGLTCDPVGGLVQVPCIERNAMGSVKAVNAARLALRGDGRHKVPLDTVIKTMWQTGQDMKSQYKETSQGGLAVNVAVC